jgi:thiamine-phosphate pyrophosphorylase
LEGARLLESYVDANSGLCIEIAKMRESIANLNSADPGGGDAITEGKIPASLALEVIESMRRAVGILAAAAHFGSLPESSRADISYTLDRAANQIGSDARAKIAERLNGIYVIVDPEATRGRPVTAVAEQSLEGGARVVQLRDKLNDKGPMLETARELKSICEAHDALFVMNDHADLARAVDADVLHVGQTDLPVGDARQILSPHQLIGNSNGGIEEALRSQEESVDYVAVGAIYATTTMGKSGRTALGPEMLTRVKSEVSQPIVAIGGINRSNIQDVVRAGAASVCVVSAITFADDPRAATEELVRLYESAAD